MAFTIYSRLPRRFQGLNLLWNLQLIDVNTFCSKEIARSLPPDDLIMNLKSATDTSQVLNTITSQTEVSNTHTMQALRTLFQLQRNGNTTVHTQQILKHPEFLQLCKNLKSKCRSLEPNDILEAMKILTYMNVPSSSAITRSLLQLARHRINELSLQHIIFLDFLLRKFESNPLVEAMLIALPLVFQIQLNIMMDHENTGQLIEYLQYVSKNKVSDACLLSIISALTLHGEDLNTAEAKSVVWSLCDIKHTHPSHEKLLNNALQVLKKNITELRYDDAVTTVSKVLNKVKDKHMIFYNEEFLDSFIDNFINTDYGFKEAAWISRKLHRVGHLSLALIEYLGNQFEKDPKQLAECRPAVIFSVVSAISFANYKPRQWEDMKAAILSHSILTTEKYSLPWTKFSVELASLDCFSDVLIDRVFREEFLEEYLSRDNNVLDHLQLLVLHQAVVTLFKEYKGPGPATAIIKRAKELNAQFADAPLHNVLERTLGGEKYLVSKVYTKLGHFIDHAIIIDANGHPVPLNITPSDSRIYAEDIVVPHDCQIICIVSVSRTCYPLNCLRLRGNFALVIRTIEAMGLPVVTISVPEWEELPDTEKMPFLLQAIKLKNEECRPAIKNVTCN